MTAGDQASLLYRPCVGVMLLNRAGRVFVGQRRDTDTPTWQMPQGGVDPGESPEAAALRELNEETGVTRDLVELVARTDDWLRYDLPPELSGRLWDGRFRGQEQLWFLMRFVGRDDQVQIETAHPEFSDWTWLAPQALLPAIVEFKRDVYAEVLRRFAGYLG